MDQILEVLQGLPIDFPNVYIALLRIIAPVLMVLLLWRAGKPLLSFKKEPEIWAVLRLPDGTAKLVTHWETVIGSDPACDLVIRTSAPPADGKGMRNRFRRARYWFETKIWNPLLERKDPGEILERNHAILIRHDNGSWTVVPADQRANKFSLKESRDIRIDVVNDKIVLNGMVMHLETISPELEQHIIRSRTRASTGLYSLTNVLLLPLLRKPLLQKLKFAEFFPTAVYFGVTLVFHTAADLKDNGVHLHSLEGHDLVTFLNGCAGGYVQRYNLACQRAGNGGACPCCGCRGSYGCGGCYRGGYGCRGYYGGGYRGRCRSCGKAATYGFYGYVKGLAGNGNTELFHIFIFYLFLFEVYFLWRGVRG